jgi:hypothetical protein
MRSTVISTLALAVALVPAAAFSQTTSSTTQPPAAQAPAAQPPAPKPPTVAFTTPSGMLLATIKPDKTAVFEEMVTKLKAGAAKSQDEALKKQCAGIKFFKATEPAQGNALYVLLVDPAVGATEYDLFQMLAKTMTPDELRAPEAADMWKKYSDAFVSGMNKLSLTALGG